MPVPTLAIWSLFRLRPNPEEEEVEEEEEELEEDQEFTPRRPLLRHHLLSTQERHLLYIRPLNIL